MKWLVQKPGTTHCAPIAFYNVCKYMGVWWMPFKLIKFLCRTDVKQKGTPWNNLIRLFRLVFPCSNFVDGPTYELVEMLLRDGFPIMINYRPDLEHQHAATIIPWTKNTVIIFNQSCDWKQYLWEEFKEEWEKIVFTTELYKIQVQIAYPLSKRKAA